MRLDRPRLAALVLAGAVAAILGGPHAGTAGAAVGFSDPVAFTADAGLRTVALADLNGDGALDVAGGNLADGASVSVLLGAGDGTLGPASSFGPPGPGNTLAIDDLDGDGHFDLVAPGGTDAILTYRGVGDGTFRQGFAHVIPVNPDAIASAELTGDGKPDLAVGHGPGGVMVMPGRGDGLYAPGPWQSFAVAGRPMDLAVADFDGDGNADVATANHFAQNVSVLLGRGDGTFEPARTFPIGARGSSIAAGDLDGDGAPDLVVGAPSPGAGPGALVLLGEGDGTFTGPTGWAEGMGFESLALADLDSDGHLDAAGVAPTRATVLLGGGDGTLGPAQSFTAADASRDLAVGDLNGDGRPDLVTQRQSPPSVLVLLNEDVSGPEVVIATPPAGATYAVGERVLADYECADERNGSGIDACDGTVPDGDPIDTDSPGRYAFEVIATDRAGNTTTRSHAYEVEAVPPPVDPPPVDPPSPPVDPPSPVDLPPELTRLRVEPRAFSAGREPTPLRGRGAEIRLRLSEDARVRFRIRNFPMRAPGGPGPAEPRGFGRRLESGANAVAFSGTLGERTFEPGRYVVVARARDSAGQVSERARARFRVMP